MATAADAELLLKLYDLRREPVMRRARTFVFEQNFQTADDLLKIQRGMGTEENAWWRQAISFWEMAASLVLRGALDADLFLDSQLEGVFFYAKFHELYKEATGADFMPHTAQLIARYPVAEQRYQAARKRFASLAQDPAAKADQAFNKG